MTTRRRDKIPSSHLDLQRDLWVFWLTAGAGIAQFDLMPRRVAFLWAGAGNELGSVKSVCGMPDAWSVRLLHTMPPRGIACMSLDRPRNQLYPVTGTVSDWHEYRKSLWRRQPTTKPKTSKKSLRLGLTIYVRVFG